MGELIAFSAFKVGSRVRLKRQPDRPFFMHDTGAVIAVEAHPGEPAPRVYVSWDLGVNHRRRGWHPADELTGSTEL